MLEILELLPDFYQDSYQLIQLNFIYMVIIQWINVISQELLNRFKK